MYTKFYDMHSGGYLKTDYDVIFIEGDENSAAAKFEEIFGFSPYGITCDCCGEDYFIKQVDEQEFEQSLIDCKKSKRNIKIIEK